MTTNMSRHMGLGQGAAHASSRSTRSVPSETRNDTTLVDTRIICAHLGAMDRDGAQTLTSAKRLDCMHESVVA